MMLKLAYQLGQKIAFDEEGLSPEQMGAAANLGGLGGGALGAGLGGLLGNYLGGRVGDRNDWNPNLSRGVGTGLGALLGGGLGAYAGMQAPHLRGTKPEPELGQLAPAGVPSEEIPPDDIMRLLQTIPGFSPGLDPDYPSNSSVGFLDDSEYGSYGGYGSY